MVKSLETSTKYDVLPGDVSEIKIQFKKGHVEGGNIYEIRMVFDLVNASHNSHITHIDTTISNTNDINQIINSLV